MELKGNSGAYAPAPRGRTWAQPRRANAAFHPSSNNSRAKGLRLRGKSSGKWDGSWVCVGVCRGCSVGLNI